MCMVRYPGARDCANFLASSRHGRWSNENAHTVRHALVYRTTESAAGREQSHLADRGIAQASLGSNHQHRNVVSYKGDISYCARHHARGPSSNGGTGRFFRGIGLDAAAHHPRCSGRDWQLKTRPTLPPPSEGKPGTGPFYLGRGRSAGWHISPEQCRIRM